jgi:hypothetical protein
MNDLNEAKAMRKYKLINIDRKTHGSKNRFFEWQEILDHGRAL